MNSNMTDPANKYISEVFRLVNLERGKAGLGNLSGNPTLKLAADIRAKELVNKFAHVRPDGTNPGTVFRENNLNYRASGETIARGFSDPSALVRSWMQSAIHKKVLLNGNYINGEVGYFKDNSGKVHIAMLFFTPLP